MEYMPWGIPCPPGCPPGFPPIAPIGPIPPCIGIPAGPPPPDLFFGVAVEIRMGRLPQ